MTNPDTAEGNAAYDLLEQLRDNVLENARDDVGQNPLSDASNFEDAAAISRTLEALVEYLYADAPQSRGPLSQSMQMVHDARNQ